jgi:nitrous oxidase accessory protein NosD
MNLRMLMLGGIALLVLPAVGWSTTVVVNPGPGTPLQDAINAAAPGTTIVIDAGTYPEAIVINKKLKLHFGSDTVFIDARSTGAAAAIDIEADQVQIKGAGAGATGGTAETFHVGPFAGVKLSGLSGFSAAPEGLVLDGTKGITVQGGEFEGTVNGVRLSGIPLGSKVKIQNISAFGPGTGMLIENSGSGALLGKGGISIKMSRFEGNIKSAGDGLVISNSSGVFVKGANKGGGNGQGSVIQSQATALSLDASSQNNRFFKLEIGGFPAVIDNGTGNCGDLITYAGTGTLAPCP